MSVSARQVALLHDIIDQRIAAHAGRPVEVGKGVVSSVIAGTRVAMVRLDGNETAVPVTFPALPVALVPGDEVVVQRRRDGWLLVDHVLGRDPTAGGGGGEHPDLAAHDALGLTTDTELAAALAGYQALASKDSAGGYPGLDGSGLVVPARLGSGTPDQWMGLAGDGSWDLRWRVWAPAADVVASNTTWVDTGFSISYAATDTSVGFVLWYIFNRQAASGSLQLRWQNTTGNTGGNVRGEIEPGTADNTGYGTAVQTTAYDTAYGGIVPNTNNAARYGRWMGRLLLPTSGSFPGTIKLQVNSAAAAEARLVVGTWLSYCKF